MRTSILMNSGFVIGTGDVSELALGWCTYNGDHMSMYNPNGSIPKTLVKFLVDWAADNEFEGEARRTLLDIVATEISPELLPAGADGKVVQATEAVIGPYELHDFFLFHFLRYGAPPEKILLPGRPGALRPRLFAGGGAPLAAGVRASASSPTSSSAPACRTGPRSARSACRRAATGACPATPRRRCGCAWLESSDKGTP